MAEIPEPEGFLRPDWSPLPRPGCRNVEGRVLLVRDGLAVAMLRFGPGATIDEHLAPHDIEVACLDGEGFVSIEDRVHSFQAGQVLHWPAGRLHRLWTAERGMVTLMLERVGED